MRKLAAILAIVLTSAILHFGAMSAVQVISQTATSHSAHASEHGAPFMPTCPSGYVCPSLPMAVTAASVVIFFVICFAIAAAFSLLVAAFIFLRAALSTFVPPNDSRTLLAVFKRE
jgi:hypothetical protein